MNAETILNELAERGLPVEPPSDRSGPISTADFGVVIVIAGRSAG
jgi:hypothetical protein